MNTKIDSTLIPITVETLTIDSGLTFNEMQPRNIKNLTLKIKSLEQLTNNLNAFKPLKTFELELNVINKINWLPLVKELPIEQFTLSGDKVSRNDLMQLIQLPFKNKCIISFIFNLPEEDYPHFKQLFVDNGKEQCVNDSSQLLIPSKWKQFYKSKFTIPASI